MVFLTVRYKNVILIFFIEAKEFSNGKSTPKDVIKRGNLVSIINKNTHCTHPKCWTTIVFSAVQVHDDVMQSWNKMTVFPKNSGMGMLLIFDTMNECYFNF